MLIIINNSEGLTCNEVLEVASDKKTTSLAELQLMQPKEIINCLAHLGKEQLRFSEADYMWQSIKTYYGGVANVPDRILTILHWVTPAIQPEEYANITFENIDVIQNFGLDYGLNNEQLAAIADGVRTEFADKDIEDYSYYDLTALRQILCAFNRSEIERIHVKAYKEASALIGKLEGCASEVMLGFATLAVKRSAFGPAEFWDDTIVKIVGNVAKYIPKNVIGKYVKKKTLT
ncbi:unnamed protein product [Colias eurytheme]|nr:unnamed protein product [Colias eurytheme]